MTENKTLSDFPFKFLLFLLRDSYDAPKLVVDMVVKSQQILTNKYPKLLGNNAVS